MSLTKLTSRLFSTSSKMASIATLKRITPTKLSEQLLSEVNAQDPTIAVIDVRDDGESGTSNSQTSPPVMRTSKAKNHKTTSAVTLKGAPTSPLGNSTQ